EKATFLGFRTGSLTRLGYHELLQNPSGRRQGRSSHKRTQSPNHAQSSHPAFQTAPSENTFVIEKILAIGIARQSIGAMDDAGIDSRHHKGCRPRLEILVVLGKAHIRLTGIEGMIRRAN